MKASPRLTKVEEEIMHLVWEQEEPVTVSFLISQMDLPHPPHSTISSIIRILEKKGYVAHKTYGRTHAYFPTILKMNYTSTSIHQIAKRYFEGSMSDLVSFLVKDKALSLKDLSEIMDRLNQDKE